MLLLAQVIAERPARLFRPIHSRIESRIEVLLFLLLTFVFLVGILTVVYALGQLFQALGYAG